MSACEQQTSSPAGASSSAPAKAAPTVSVGTKVVAAVSEVGFRQGTIIRAEGDKITIEHGRPQRDTGRRPTSTVGADRVWPVGAPITASKGDSLVCRVIKRKARPGALPSWYPCKVLEVVGGKYKVEDHYGLVYQLDPSSLIAPDDDTRKKIATYLEKEKRHRTFDRAFEQAGDPFRPAGWVPAKGEKVVIHFVGTSWYGGTVVEHKVDKGKVRVHWEGDRWDDRDVPVEAVAPQPDKRLTVNNGQFAIVRPKLNDDRWEHVRVEGVSGDEVVVSNRDHHKRTVRASNILPIVAR